MKATYSIRTCLLLLSLTIGTFFPGCKKLVEVDGPVTSTNGANVYTNDATAAAILTGVYTTMSSLSPSTGSSLDFTSVYLALSADELTLYSNANVNYFSYYTNALTNSTPPNIWTSEYPVLFILNSAIEGLNSSSGLTPGIKQQLLGEAKFLRAFGYFYLVNLYGDVPLILSTDYKANSLLSRTPKAQVYQQIIADLKDAQNLLSPNFLKADILTTTTERVRPTKWAATALLARAYLYTGDWAGAAAQATTLIGNSAQFGLVPLSGTFQKNSREAIWQLQPVNAGWNTEDARIFILPSTGPSNTYPIYLSNNLLGSFETGDSRKSSWVSSLTIGTTTYSYPYKYKSATLNSAVSEYEMVLRLGEQYLIRAEAYAQQGNAAAKTDLDSIRVRAMLPVYAGPTDKTSLLTAIFHERQVELFTEWGNRWLDLKRSGTVDAVMGAVTPQKGGSWKTSWQLYPIPLTDLTAAPNLAQNPGY